jgi:hypothetical protein
MSSGDFLTWQRLFRRPAKAATDNQRHFARPAPSPSELGLIRFAANEFAQNKMAAARRAIATQPPSRRKKPSGSKRRQDWHNHFSNIRKAALGNPNRLRPAAQYRLGPLHRADMDKSAIGHWLKSVLSAGR